jgi:hypothetical protein
MSLYPNDDMIVDAQHAELKRNLMSAYHRNYTELHNNGYDDWKVARAVDKIIARFYDRKSREGLMAITTIAIDLRLELDRHNAEAIQTAKDFSAMAATAVQLQIEMDAKTADQQLRFGKQHRAAGRTPRY